MTIATAFQWLGAAGLLAVHRLTQRDALEMIAARLWRPALGLLAARRAAAQRSAPMDISAQMIATGEAMRAAHARQRYMTIQMPLDSSYGFLLAEELAEARAAEQNAPPLTQPKGDTNMNLNFPKPSLAAIGAALAAVAPVAEASRPLYQFGAQMIAAMENAYTEAGAGTHKRLAVVAAVEALGEALAVGYPAIKASFEPWLESVITAYNAGRAVVQPAAAPVDPIAATTATVSEIQRVVAETEAIAAPLIAAGEALFSPAPAPTVATPTQLANPFATVGAVPAANTQGL